MPGRGFLVGQGLFVQVDDLDLGTGASGPLDRLGVAPAESLMVGNSLSRDVVGGKRAGLHTCWLALDDEEEPVGLVEPDFTIRSLGELPRLVLG